MVTQTYLCSMPPSAYVVMLDYSPCMDTDSTILKDRFNLICDVFFVCFF